MYIAVPVTQFRICETIKYLSFFISLYHRQRSKGLGKHGHFFHMYGYFTRFSNKRIAFYTDDIANIEKLLKYGIVHGIILTRAQLVTVQVKLDPPGRILKLGKRSEESLVGKGGGSKGKS